MTIESVIAQAEKYPFNITAEAKGKTATVRITGIIWSWNNQAAWFRKQIEKFNAEGVTTLIVYINTPGGSVFEANEIYNEIKAFKGEVKGEGGALVASAGTYIALACDTFEMPTNGQWMYHKPMARIEGNEDAVESDLKLLKNLTLQYKKAYADKTKLSAKAIEKNWSKGDVWLNAEDALKDGFITGIKKEPAKIDKETTAQFKAFGCPTAYTPDMPEPKNTKKKHNQNSNSMEPLEVLALQLGLPKTSTQAEVDAHLQSLQDKAAKADQLEASAKAKEKTDKDAAITALLDSAVKGDANGKGKKLTAVQAEGLKAWAKSDFDGCKAHIDSLPELTAISQQIKGTASPSASASAVADKKFDALSEEEIADLSENDPEAFKAKYDAYLEASNA